MIQIKPGKFQLAFTLVLLFTLILSACKSVEEYPQPATSLRSKIQGPAFGVTLGIPKDKPIALEFKEEPLSQELAKYIRDNLNAPAYRYLVQLEPTVGLLWIDTKSKKTKLYYPRFDETFAYVQSALVSPNGDYIAVNLTKAKDDPWSKFMIIYTDSDTAYAPLNENSLLLVKEDSTCEKIELVERRLPEHQGNECIAEGPKTPYLIDYWSRDNRVELIKQFATSTILYSVDTDA